MLKVESKSLLAPKEWQLTITVERTGRDEFGDPLPATSHEIRGCLIGTQQTTDIVDNRAIITTTRMLTAPVAVDLCDGDKITAPATSWCRASVWVIDGEPDFTPLGTRARLRRPEDA